MIFKCSPFSRISPIYWWFLMPHFCRSCKNLDQRYFEFNCFESNLKPLRHLIVLMHFIALAQFDYTHGSIEFAIEYQNVTHYHKYNDVLRYWCLDLFFGITIDIKIFHNVMHNNVVIQRRCQPNFFSRYFVCKYQHLQNYFYCVRLDYILLSYWCCIT